VIDRPRLLALAARVLRLEAQAVLDLAGRLDDGFVRAVALMRDCAGRVVVTGMGKSGLVGRKIAATLASTGTPAYFLHPAEGVHGDIGMLARGDVMLVLSNSGETEEVLAVLPAIKRLGIPLVLLTGTPASTLARQADVVIDVAVAEEACPMQLAPTSSTTAALAMGDALAMGLLDVRGLGPEDYAALHPRGALGWKALFRVRDLMHTGEALPVVAEHAAMKQAIEEMTAKRLGMTTVVDGRGRLVGIVTDGDLRRQQLAFGSLLDRPVVECMTRNPQRIGADELAARALDLMETHTIDGQSRPITSLVITDAAGRPVGVIHLHDILRAKIV
jgi:arabinose-5-phosphate isomerase